MIIGLGTCGWRPPSAGARPSCKHSNTRMNGRSACFQKAATRSLRRCVGLSLARAKGSNPVWPLAHTGLISTIRATSGSAVRNRDPSAVPDCRGEDPLRHQVSGADVSAGCSRRARRPLSCSSACSVILKNAGASPLNCRPGALRSICSALRRLSLHSLPASSVSECAGCVCASRQDYRCQSPPPRRGRYLPGFHRKWRRR